MTKKFSMKDLLNEQSKSDSGPSQAFTIQHLDLRSIYPDDRNFYSVNDVQDLKDAIAMVGLQQNLVVRRGASKNGYTLISGHRRLKALQLLVEEGHTEYQTVPCKVEVEQSTVDEMFSELRLIFGNATSRQLSDYEKTQQAARMKELLTALKKNGTKIPGRLRDLIADTLKTSPSKVGRMENIAGNLAPEFQDEFRQGRINLSAANELAGLPEHEQHAAYQDYQTSGKITVSDVKDRKIAPKKPAPILTPIKETPPSATATPTPDADHISKPEEYRVCANCGLIIEDEWYKCLDNFLQIKYFEEQDESDNVFCSKDCFCESLSLEEMGWRDRNASRCV